MDKIKEYIISHRQIIIVSIILILLIIAIFGSILKHKSEDKENIPIKQETSNKVDYDTVLDAFNNINHKISPNESKDIAKQIETVSIKEVPVYHYITTSAEQADNKAQEIKKDNKADTIINARGDASGSIGECIINCVSELTAV